MFDEIALQRHGAGRAGGQDEIGIAFEHGVDILLGQLDGGLFIPGIEGRYAAAVLLLRIEDLDIEGIHHRDQVEAQFRVEEVVGAAAEQGDPVARLVDLLRHVSAMTSRSGLSATAGRVRHSVSGEKNSGRWRMRPFPAGDRFLQHAGGAEQAMEQLAVTHHLAEDDVFAGADPLFLADGFAQVRMISSRSILLGQTATQERQPMQARTISAALSRPWKKAVRMMPMAPI